MRSVRCSSLPLVTACAPAAAAAGCKVESDRAPADLGTAFHACMARLVAGDVSPAVSVPEEAARHHVPEGDLAPLVWAAARDWRQVLAHHFPAPLVELELSARDAAAGVELVGHTDVLSYCAEDREVRVIDYKSGYVDADARDQLRGYGLLGLLRHPAAETAAVTLYRVREGRAETERYTRGELLAWWEWVASHLADDATYRPGEHCERCPRAFDCPARTAALRQAAAWLPAVADAVPELDAEGMADVLVRARALAKVLDRVVAAIKSEVALRGDSYGRMYLRPETRTSIDVGRGHGVLARALGADTLTPLFKVSKGDVEDAARATAPRGQKAAAVKALMEQLAEAGAIETTTIHKLEVRKHAPSTDQLGPAGGDGAGEAR